MAKGVSKGVVKSGRAKMASAIAHGLVSRCLGSFRRPCRRSGGSRGGGVRAAYAYRRRGACTAVRMVLEVLPWSRLLLRSLGWQLTEGLGAGRGAGRIVEP